MLCWPYTTPLVSNPIKSPYFVCISILSDLSSIHPSANACDFDGIENRGVHVWYKYWYLLSMEVDASTGTRVYKELSWYTCRHDVYLIILSCRREESFVQTQVN